MNCKHCEFYWADPDDLYSHCHFERRTVYDKAPCEFDERKEY